MRNKRTIMVSPDSCFACLRTLLGVMGLLRSSGAADGRCVMQLNQLRREVAELLRNNKQEHARIRVEAVLRESNLLKAYDILELFTEMLAVRVQMIDKSKDTPLDMLEALSSIVYASQRIQVCSCSTSVTIFQI